jgi:outer membrane protein OmpA-like peptidoglycan-associated protein
MAEDWSIDVRKYVPDADADIIAGIVRYCGIALRNRDSSLVSFTDSTETDRVKANFLRKKLGLTDADDVLDAAIAKVGERMKADRTKNRVTVYYLLAEAFGRLGDFRPKAGKAKAEPEAVLPLVAAPEPVMAPPPPPPPPPPPAPVAAPAPVAPLMAAVPAARAVARPAARKRTGLFWPLGFALATFGGIAWLIIAGSSKPGAAPVMPAAPAAVAAPVVPDGAGVTVQDVAGRPQVSVYFDTAKTDLDASFGEKTQALRDWLAANPGHHLVVSGYNDPRGDAAFNAALSKSRAFAVRDALVALGVATDEIDLVKPADTNDSDTSLAEARRVDVSIADGPVPEGEAATQATPPTP